jgi:hypothetical protein
MGEWTAADFAILGIGGFIAVTSLVRIMIQRRNSVVRDLDEQIQLAKVAAEESTPT